SALPDFRSLGACPTRRSSDLDVYFSTFAKSMASIGAFIAADQDIIDYLKYNLRSQMFAKSLPMIFVKGALKRLDLLRSHPELKKDRKSTRLNSSHVKTSYAVF